MIRNQPAYIDKLGLLTAFSVILSPIFITALFLIGQQRARGRQGLILVFSGESLSLPT